MGTNYYWRFGACEHCGRFNEVHVCKSSHTWRAYPHRLLNPEHPDWGYSVESPVGWPVLSLKDWARVFAEHPGTLWDEYGTEVDDPETFLAEATPPGPERRAELAEYWRDNTFYDPEGFYFIAGEFC
jgi:hypothetical protein